MADELAKAQTHLLAGRPSDALACLDRVLRADIHNAIAHSERGVALFHLGRKAEALLAMDAALELEPHNPYRYASRAFLRDATGDLPGAIADYQQALALDPDDAVAQNNLGLLEEKLGYRESAQRRFQTADELAKKMGYEFTNPSLIEREKAKQSADTAPVKAVDSTTTDSTDATAPKLSLGYYWQTLTEVVRSPSSRREFWDFLQKKTKSQR